MWTFVCWYSLWECSWFLKCWTHRTCLELVMNIYFWDELPCWDTKVEDETCVVEEEVEMICYQTLQQQYYWEIFGFEMHRFSFFVVVVICLKVILTGFLQGFWFGNGYHSLDTNVGFFFLWKIITVYNMGYERQHRLELKLLLKTPKPGKYSNGNYKVG